MLHKIEIIVKDACILFDLIDLEDENNTIDCLFQNTASICNNKEKNENNNTYINSKISTDFPSFESER